MMHTKDRTMNKHYITFKNAKIEYVEDHGHSYTVHFSTPWMTGKAGSMIKQRMPKAGQTGTVVIYKDKTDRHFFSSVKV